MLDLYQVGYSMAAPLKSYTGVAQLIEANQDIPPEALVYPRITYNFISPYNSEARQSMAIKQNVVDSQESEFDKDIEYSYQMNPQVTVSINAYGVDVSLYIGKAREWFTVPQLGPRFFEGYKCVVSEVLDTQDRKTYLETTYEDRQGFDVKLQFDEEIKIVEKTIEQVEIKTPEETKSINL